MVEICSMKTKILSEYKEETINQAKFLCLIKTARSKRYGRLIQKMRDQDAFKINVYPKKLDA